MVVLVLTAVRSAIADWNDVPTGSMRPTILEGDRIFVNKLAYDLKVPFTTWHIAKWADPHRNDVVIFYSPEDGTRLVKRVIGEPGDLIEMRGEKLIINGVEADYGQLDSRVTAAISPEGLQGNQFAWETFGNADRHPVMATPGVPAMRSFGPVRVPAGQYLVLGDNRDNSKDSRFIGFVPRGKIVGKAVGVAISVDPEHHYLPRWGRWGQGFAQ
jgi:signal peptidase I